MELHKTDIRFNPNTRKLKTTICVSIEEHNGMILKAKAEFVAALIDTAFALMEGKQAEYEELYGPEALRHAHPVEGSVSPQSFDRKYVHSQEVMTNLLDRAFQEKDNG